MFRRSNRLRERARAQANRIRSEIGALTSVIVNEVMSPNANITRLTTTVEVIGGQGMMNADRWYDFRQVFDRFMGPVRRRFGGAHVTIALSDPQSNTHFYRNQRGLNLDDINSQFIVDLLSHYQSSQLAGGGNLSQLKIVFHIVQH